MTFSLQDLEALGKPDIIETVSFQALLEARKAKYVAEATLAGLDFDVAAIETDPVVISLREAAFKEVFLRARGNDIARARYLYFATGSAIDHQGAFYDCVRLAGETDDRYKLRIVLAIQGRSTGGPEALYRLIALSTSLRVRDAKVYRIGRSPLIHVAILAADNNGVADPALLNAVTIALSDPYKVVCNDHFEVRAAVQQVIAVTADVWLLPGTDETILTTLPGDLKTRWDSEGGLGRDLIQPWIVSRLMTLGVMRAVVTSPSSDIIMPPYQAVSISSVTLTNRGRDY